MNIHHRRRRREMGVALLSELIADVLAEAQQDGTSGWLTVAQIRQGAGFESGYKADDLCRGILCQMLKHYEVSCTDGGVGGEHIWRLRG